MPLPGLQDGLVWRRASESLITLENARERCSAKPDRFCRRDCRCSITPTGSAMPRRKSVTDRARSCQDGCHQAMSR